MKFFFNLCRTIIALLALTHGAFAQTTEEVTGLVKETRTAIEQNAVETFQRILRAESPFKSKDNPSLYVFILDTELNVVAHPIQPQRVGNNMKGKPDIKGKLFRDEMLAIALKDGKGWVDYYYLNPETRHEMRKQSYFELANGSDGKQYIVGSGRYHDEK